MFFKTFAQKQIESKGHSYDDDLRKANREIARLKAALAAATSSKVLDDRSNGDASSEVR